MTDYVVGPDGTLPDEAHDIDAHTMLVGSTPLLVLAARYRAIAIGPAGELVADDEFVAGSLTRGAQPLTDLSFVDSAAAGWHAVLTAGTCQLRVTDPTDTPVYDGTLTPADAWLAPVRTAAASGHGLPIVLCSAGDPDAVLDAMAACRATWVRAHIDLR